MQFEIRNRWTGAVQFTAEIDATYDTPRRVKIGLAVKWARRTGADLRGADLSGAVLRDADLSGAVLRGADWIPVIPNIHTAVYAAASQDGALDMGNWHTNGFCGTTHCRAGWVTHLAGDAGRVMDALMGTSAAAALIYAKSDPKLERVPNFYASNSDALADMKRLADAEAT